MTSRTIFSVRLLVLGLLVIALCVSLGCGNKDKAEQQTTTTTTTTTTTEKSTSMGQAVDDAKEAAGDMAMLANPKPGIDPVCGMELGDNRVTIEVDGKKYGFCSADCAAAFREDPAKYLAANASGEGEMPMHDN